MSGAAQPVTRRTGARGFPLLLSFFLLLLAAPPAAAHGGVYRGPTGPGSAGPVSPGGVPTKGGAAPFTGWPRWRYWWDLNWDRVLDTRVRLASAAATFAADEGGEKGGVDWRDYRPLSPAEKERLLLPPLLEALNDADAEVRAAAALALGKAAAPASLKALTGRLGDKERLVRNAACLALGLTRLSEAEAVMLRYFRSQGIKDETRAWLAVGLGYLGTRPACSALIAKLQALTGKSVPNADKQLLSCCAAGLSVCRSPSVVPEIIHILDRAEGRKSDVQGLLLLALGKIGDRRALSAVVRRLDHDKANIRLGAMIGASLLAEPRDGEVVARLSRLAAEEPQVTSRALALVALGRVGGPALRERLRRSPVLAGKGLMASALETFAATGLVLAGGPAVGSLADSDPAKRGAFAMCHAIAGDRSCTGRLAALLAQEKNPGAFSEMALAAGMLRAREARPLLRRVLAEEKRAEFRTAAAIALGFLGDAQALDMVLQLLARASSARQQGPLLFAATLFGRRKCVERIVELLRRRGVQDSVRALCCVALGNIGDSRRHPVLSDLTHDFPWPLGSPVLNQILRLY